LLEDRSENRRSEIEEKGDREIEREKGKEVKCDVSKSSV
jgi:hypothetical protein